MQLAAARSRRARTCPHPPLSVRPVGPQDLNPFPLAITVINTIVWLAYGLLKQDPYVTTPNVPGIGLSMFMTLTAYGLADDKVGGGLPLRAGPVARLDASGLRRRARPIHCLFSKFKVEAAAARRAPAGACWVRCQLRHTWGPPCL